MDPVSSLKNEEENNNAALATHDDGDEKNWKEVMSSDFEDAKQNLEKLIYRIAANGLMPFSKLSISIPELDVQNKVFFSYSHTTAIPLLFFGFYALRMIFVEPLYTWLPYIPGVSPIYGQGRLYRESSEMTMAIVLHACCGACMCFLGSVQFDKYIRHRYKTFHRWCGRLYVVCGGTLIWTLRVLRKITGQGTTDAPSVGMQYFNDALVVIWTVSIVLALFFIYTGNIEAHRRFMTRNFIYSLVPVVQRLVNVVPVFLGYFCFCPLLLFYDFYYQEPFWDSGEYFFTLNGFGRMQEFLFPLSAWVAFFTHVIYAEIKIRYDQDLWVEIEFPHRYCVHIFWIRLWDICRIYLCQILDYFNCRTSNKQNTINEIYRNLSTTPTGEDGEIDFEEMESLNKPKKILFLGQNLTI